MSTFRLFGSYSDMLQQLAQLLAIRSQLDDRDIGSWIGYPVGDYAKAKTLGRKLYIQLYSEPQPPFRPQAGKPWKICSITVPEPSRATCGNWAAIKAACGGAAGFKFGKYRTTVVYVGGRQTVVQCDTKKRAEELAGLLSKLSTLQVQSMKTTETKPVGIKAPGKRMAVKEVQIYPGSYYVLEQANWVANPASQTNKQNNKVSTNERDLRRSRIKRIALWTQKAPSTLKKYLDEMFRY